MNTVLFLECVFLGGAILFSLWVSFFFSGSETAVLSVNQYRLEHRSSQGDRSAAKAVALLEDPSRVITAVLIGTNLGNVFAILLFKVLIGRLWPVLREPAVAGVRWDELISLAAF